MYSLKKESEFLKKGEPLASIVKRLGNPESTTLLYSSCHIFQIPDVDGVIGYHQIGNCAVAIGDPICLPRDIASLAQAFHHYCQNNGLKTLYLLTYHDFATWAINNGCHTLIQVGSELSINPCHFQKKQKLRWKINQSIQHGVEVKEYKDFNPALENQMQMTINRWLQHRKGPQIHLGKINFFSGEGQRRIFYAKHQENILGVLMLTPLDRFQGWVMSSYLTLPNAPVGTTENLMCTTFECLAQENCDFLCLGAISGTHLGATVGLTPFAKTLANFIFQGARWFFELDAKASYLNKFHPCLRSTFLLCRDKITLSELLAIKHVLNVRI